MGQYYKVVNIDKQEFVTPFDYGGGLKLMEHSWLLNSCVNSVVAALKPGGSWQGNRIVWAGDYMDEGLFLKHIKGKPKECKTLYSCCSEEDNDTSCILKVRPILPDGPEPKYIVNINRKEFVSLTGLPEEDPSEAGWHIHPLPLLTCSGNGRGGGDFCGDGRYVGKWAGQRIRADYTVPLRYKELKPDFTEQNQ